MDERTTERQLTAWVALVEAHSAAMDGVEQELVAEAGLPLSWHEVLMRLSRAEGGAMRMQELARAVLLSKSGLTRLADRMVASGLIERSACGADRRGMYAVITERGREALDRATPVFAAAVDRNFARHLQPSELEGLAGSLRKVARGQGIPEDESCTAVVAEASRAVSTTQVG
jgi:DNA-binding MarR family transcriptional regulator